MLLVVFFTGILPTAVIETLLPLIIGFNTALTGYMVIEKTRNRFVRKRTLAMGAGVAVVLVTALLLNLLFLQWVGFNLIGLESLPALLLVGIVTSVLGGMLAVKYFNLNESMERRLSVTETSKY
jgi:hypothetical protein